VLADSSINIMTYQSVFLAWLLGMGLKPILTSDTKKCQQAFLAPLLGMGPKPVLSSDAKKCQQPHP
jgi:hypothetical protein